jgi:hypothetical protein
MGPCIVSIFQYTRISNKMQRYTVYLYMETALHISGGTSTHHQERIQLYLQHLVFVAPLLLSVAIVEELEPVWVCCGWRTPPTAHSYWFSLCIFLHSPVTSSLLGANTLLSTLFSNTLSQLSSRNEHINIKFKENLFKTDLSYFRFLL